MFTLLLLPFGLGFVLSVYAEIQMIRKAASVHVGWLLGTLATPVAATGFALFVLPRLQPAMAVMRGQRAFKVGQATSP